MLRLPSARPGFLTLCAPLRLPRTSRACFIPEPPVGFHPSGPSPSAEPWHLSVPAALLVFARNRSRPTARLPARLRATHRQVARALRLERPSALDAGPDCPRDASFTRTLRRLPRGSRSADARNSVSADGAGRRTAPGSPSGPFSLQRARSPRPVVRPCRGRCPHGLLPLQGSLARSRGRLFSAALPSRTSSAAAVANHGEAAGPPGMVPVSRLGAPLARGADPHEVFHLFTPGSRFDPNATSGCRRWFPTSFRVPVHPLSLEPRGCVAAPQAGPLRGGPSRPGLRPVKPRVAVTDPTMLQIGRAHV